MREGEIPPSFFIRSSAEAVAGGFADYFSDGFATSYRPVNLTERKLSDFLFGRPRPKSEVGRFGKQTFNVKLRSADRAFAASALTLGWVRGSIWHLRTHLHVNQLV